MLWIIIFCLFLGKMEGKQLNLEATKLFLHVQHTHMLVLFLLFINVLVNLPRILLCYGLLFFCSFLGKVEGKQLNLEAAKLLQEIKWKNILRTNTLLFKEGLSS